MSLAVWSDIMDICCNESPIKKGPLMIKRIPAKLNEQITTPSLAEKKPAPAKG